MLKMNPRCSPIFRYLPPKAQVAENGEILSGNFLNCKAYSPTSQAGWGLNPGLGTVELVS